MASACVGDEYTEEDLPADNCNIIEGIGTDEPIMLLLLLLLEPVRVDATEFDPDEEMRGGRLFPGSTTTGCKPTEPSPPFTPPPPPPPPEISFL